MKIIGRLSGVSAFRESPEEYIPEGRQPPIQNLVELIRTTYQFVSFPIFGPGIPLNAPWVFAGGRFSDGAETFAIPQLIMLTDVGQMAIIVVTTSTSDSDLVLEHLMRLLEEKFAYRLAPTQKQRIYMSTLVVEFDQSLSTYIEKIGRMEAIIDADRPGRLLFKGLSFGQDSTATALDPQNPLIRVETADFTIERRVGQARNRYFCNAPMTTADHIHSLEQIEVAARETV
jgi:hypothetical protein